MPERMPGRFTPTTPARAPRPESDDDSPSDFAAAIAMRRHVDVLIPRTKVKGRLRLCSRKEELEAKSAARAAMIEAGFPVNAEAHATPGAGEQWLMEVAVQMLAVAVRDPSNEKLALAELEDWRECDDMQLVGLWNRYQDLTTELDPVAAESLTELETAAISAAGQRKDPEVLMSFGSRKLALFISSLPPAPPSAATAEPLVSEQK